MSHQKVALVYDAIYPFIKGGGERRFHEFGRRLAKDGDEVHLYGMKLWDGPKTINRDGMILHGIMKARPLYTKSGRRSISQALLFGVACFKLLAVDFDVIDCCGFPYFSLFPAKLAAIIKRKPLFATWHEVWGKAYWNEYIGKLGFIGYGFEWLAAKLPDHIIAGSLHTSNMLSGILGVNSAAIVPNGVSLEAIEAVGPTKDRSDIIYAGRLMDFKNVHLIVESLAELKNKGTNLTLSVVGEGPAKSSLQILAKKIGIDRQINWLGFLEKSEDVYSHIKGSKIFILPSSREGFGIVAIEANACGKPVLTANYVNNAAKDLIKSGVNGYIFEPTTHDLSLSIEKVLKEFAKLESSTRKLAREYSWDRLALNIKEVYAL